jgi:hypothetical protein
LPYPIKVRHLCGTSTDEYFIAPKPLAVDLPSHFQDVSIRIPVNDPGVGLYGEIALVHSGKAAVNEKKLAKESAVYAVDEGARFSARYRDRSQSALIRGGFRIGHVPGLPDSFKVRFAAKAMLELRWENQENRRYVATNLSRSAPVEKNKIEHAVVRNWLSWLLEHVDELPEGLIQSVGIRGRVNLNQCSWLERFDGLTVYRLATNGWFSWLRSPEPVKEEVITAWEASHGTSLPLEKFQSDLQNQLLDLVLPRICKLSMGSEAQLFVSSPIEGWRTILEGCKDFISKPIEWGPYVKYRKEIEHLLYYKYASSARLNGEYRERVGTEFFETELPALQECLHSLAESQQQNQVEMSLESISIARRAQQALGELQIGGIHGSWRIDSYKLQ